ncbi:DUF4191 domain-containing protein [Cellulomonas sp. zg-ZUI222]|uniref:DUF4191 domain-containing protein n=1 Tax=Cellulomonas wangleii TaxID=2816956 RepID=A0ABX8D109_9CELL|nr:MULTISPECIES: DUF4191 domain-containing protein [Cellulomonas]MBO0900078.1 DUF4191 domain-containing protein [Cellulomonas sp. zg-ZUI22]MBO0921007.1 DUF4191 domain-containing protein [Cellulomonas wangleii]MBO0925511.1 DUF4191 domain-containing protein [Cellulomonas wangleii]QVI61019.1 DUF4191 domain-containing protein [Cellulomonas wangleii]
MARERSRSPQSPPESTAKGSGKVKKTRWYHQLWQAYQITRQTDPAVTWIMLGVLVGIIAVGVLVGQLIGQPVYVLVLSIPFAVLGAMFVLARRAETAAYSRIEGQPGASLAALGTLRRGWTFTQEPVAADPRTQDLVFRGVGKPGVVLVGEGPPHRIGKLLEAERKRTARVVSGAPIHLIQVGDGDGQVPLRKLPRTVTKLKGQLTKDEVAVVLRRVTSLGGARLPVPKGIDPMRARPDRKGMRGR